MSDNSYIPPDVWKWDQDSGGTFSKTNRPIAGVTHRKKLPVGKQPLQLYSLATPNGVKITILLEELLALGFEGAEYDAWLVKIDGNQFGSGFVELNPNSKIPTFADHSSGSPIRIFESGAIIVKRPSGDLPVYLRRLPVDFRKAINGLSIIVLEDLDYLIWVFAKLPGANCVEDIEALLPWNVDRYKLVQWVYA